MCDNANWLLLWDVDEGDCNTTGQITLMLVCWIDIWVFMMLL